MKEYRRDQIAAEARRRGGGFNAFNDLRSQTKGEGDERWLAYLCDDIEQGRVK